LTAARFTRPARTEFLAQIAHYEEHQNGLGARFRSEVEAAVQRAATFPLHGKPSAGGTRRRLVTGFPFSVVYTETEYGVLIHAVADGRHRPDYWLDRM
jgi:toxin ParE1/3/4